MKRIALLLIGLALGSVAWAASPWAGVWVMRDSPKTARLTMVLEEKGAGWKVTYRIPAPGAAAVTLMTIETALDGKDAAILVDGKPIGQTMDIRRVDDRHTVTVMKSQGKQTGVSKSELSADGKVIRSENESTASGPTGVAGKQFQYWDKQ